jgi:micrococcal nuclease
VTARWHGLLVAFAAGLVAITGCSGDDKPDSGAGEAVVVHPVDGDTIAVEVGGVEERVRFIGIDTPESVAEDRPVECYGPESKARTAELLPVGTRIRLERDVESRDRFGRLLAYVTRADDGLLVNLALVEEGYAITRSYPPNTARDSELRAAQSTARAEGRGLWGACGGADKLLPDATGGS